MSVSEATIRYAHFLLTDGEGMSYDAEYEECRNRIKTFTTSERSEVANTACLILDHGIFEKLLRERYVANSVENPFNYFHRLCDGLLTECTDEELREWRLCIDPPTVC